MANNNQSFDQMVFPCSPNYRFIASSNHVENFELKLHFLPKIESNQFGRHGFENLHNRIFDFLQQCDIIIAKDLSAKVI